MPVNKYRPIIYRILAMPEVELLHEWHENGRPRALIYMGSVDRPSGPEGIYVIAVDEGIMKSDRQEAERILASR